MPKIVNINKIISDIRYWGLGLNEVPKVLRTKEVCFASVKIRGDELEYVPKSIITEKLCLIAVKQNGLSIEYVPKNL